jgi:hypothetical protein
MQTKQKEKQKELFTIEQKEILCFDGTKRIRFDINFNTSDSVFNSSFENFKWNYEDALKYAEQALGIQPSLERILDTRLSIGA